MGRPHSAHQLVALTYRFVSPLLLFPSPFPLFPPASPRPSFSFSVLPSATASHCLRCYPAETTTASKYFLPSRNVVSYHEREKSFQTSSILMPPNLFQSLSSLSTSPASPLDSTADADHQEEVEANDAKDHLPKFCHGYT